MYVQANTKAVTCIKCKTYYCVKCSRKWHQGKCLTDIDEGYDLRRFRKWLDEQDPRMVRPCPVCNTVITRNEGCKFMTCKSAECGGKTYFCMCCAAVLKEKHQDHFCTVEGKDYEGSRLEHNCQVM